MTRQAATPSTAWILLGCLTASAPALAAADAAAPAAAAAAAGKALFQDQCTVCHSAATGDGGGAQGPSLIGVSGRRAASVPGFAYTAALKTSNLTWDAPTLLRFLKAPTTLVPGTAMLIAVPAAADRENLVAYFQSLAGAPAATSPAESPRPVPNVTKRSADWRKDEPGRTHRIRVAALPAAFATPSSSNGPRLVERPAAAALRVPRGFHIEPFADNLSGPRKMLVAANGDIFVVEPRAGRISLLHPTPDGTRAASTSIYASGLKQPFGIAFYPSAAAPEWLYVAETHRVIRYAYQAGDINPHGDAEIVIPELPNGGGHYTRDIAFSQDGTRLFVSVGSGSNVAETMSKKTAVQIGDWEATHGLGAAWDQETDRAAVLVFDAKAPGAAKSYATGIRNCVSLTIQPVNGALWCTTNERDLLGDDLVPDYSTRVREGGFYGWPWYYFGPHQDPRLQGERPDLAGRATVPDLAYQAHSAALSMTFYTPNAGDSAFPVDYAGDAFTTFHGSWNRSLRTGYKVVRARMKNGLPTGDYTDFVTGFIVDDGNVWGRPVATVQLEDGSLLLSDDGSNTVFRISHVR